MICQTILRSIGKVFAATLFGYDFNPRQWFDKNCGSCSCDTVYIPILQWSLIADQLTETVVDIAEATLGKYELVNFAEDDQIRAELPEGHVFPSMSIFFAHLADMIEGQPKAMGEGGGVLSRNRKHLFYVQMSGGEVAPVVVYWGGIDGQWGMCLLEKTTRDPLTQVFSVTS